MMLHLAIRRRALFVLPIFLLGLPCTAVHALVERIDTRLPRDYGYFVGDTIVQRVSATLSESFALDRASLPKPGRVDRWLWLQSVAVESRGVTSDIELRYQLLTAPQRTRKIVVPEKSIYFVNGSERVPVIVEPFVFWASPMIQDGVEEAAFMTVQPALAPPVPSARRHRLAIAVGIVFSVAGLLLLLYVYGAVPGLRRSHGPFARAVRQLTAAGGDGGDYRAGMRRVHHAFDATAGAVLLARDLPSFFAEHREFAILRTRIEAFYETSQRLFFGTGEAPEDNRQQWRGLIELCRACRDVERGLA